MEHAFAFDDPILLERFIHGRFYTVGFYESKGKVVTLPVVEGLDLDREEGSKDLIKFTGNYGIRESDLHSALTREIHDMAEKVFHITGARGVARVDFMVDEETNIPYVLEINAVPGLKRKSLMPREAKLCGIVYEDMIEDILRAAL